MDENFSPKVRDVITFQQRRSFDVWATTLLAQNIFFLGLIKKENWQSD